MKRTRSIRVLAASVLASAAVAMSAASAAAVPLPYFDESTPGSATYDVTGVTPLAGDFDGDGRDDLFLYRPGSSAEQVKFGKADRTFTISVAATYQVSGTYRPFVGDFDANGNTDIFWYAPGPAADYLWTFGALGTKTSTLKSVSGTYTPLVGDFDRTGTVPNADDIFWYAPGTAPDALWHATGHGGFTSKPQTVNGTYTPLVGGFTPETGPIYGGSVDLSQDIFWYGPGSVGDSLWDGNNDGTWTKIPKKVSGTYQPFVGLFDGYGVDDIFWYSPTGSDFVWLGDPDTGEQVSFPATVPGGFTPIVGRFRIPGEPILWWAPAGEDRLMLPNGAPGVWAYLFADDPPNTDMAAGYLPVAGDFDGNGHRDLFWLSPGPGIERIFWGRG